MEEWRYIFSDYSHWYFFFFFNRSCNPCGFWLAKLSLIILSREVFTVAARQTPQLGGPVIRTFQLSPQGVPSV